MAYKDLCFIAGLPTSCGTRTPELGLQIVGRPFDEATVLRVGRAWEQLLGGFTRPSLP